MIRLLLYVIVLSACAQAEKKTTGNMQEVRYIPCSQFMDSVSRATRLLETRSWNSVPTCILLAKLDNTLSVDDSLLRDAKIMRYNDLRVANHKAVLDTQIKYLEATIGMGMGYYSPRHKIYIGGSPDSASMFILQNKDCLGK